MGNGNFWQLFLGKEPYSKKSDFVKAWLLWWAITILVLFIFKPDYDIKFKKYRYRVKFWLLSNPW